MTGAGPGGPPAPQSRDLASLSDRRFLGVVTTLALLAVSFPYFVLAAIHPAGATYTGALFSPIDVYGYIGHMLRSWDGSWLWQNSWTYQATSRPMIYIAYTALGKLVPAGGVPWGPALALHVVRLVFTLLFIRQAWRLYREVLPGRGTYRVAMLIMLFTSGLGLVYSLIPGDVRLGGALYDLTSPQSSALFTLLQAPQNAAQMFLLMVVLRAVYAVLKSVRIDWHMVARAGLAVAAISLIHVDKMIVLGLTVFLVMAWMRLVTKAVGGRLVRQSLALAGMLLPGVPYFLYLAVIRHDQVLQLTLAQWPPPSLGYLMVSVPIGYGIPGALAVVALVRLARRPRAAPLGLVFLSAFAVSGLVLLPFSRGLPGAEGSQVALAGLAAVALVHDVLPRLWRGPFFQRMARRRLFGYSRRRLRLLTINLVLIAASPTVIALVFASPRAVLAEPAAQFYVMADDARVLEWMNTHVAHDDVVVGTPESAEFVVAYGGARVVYGDPFYTPAYDREGRQLRDYFQGTADPGRYLQARNIQWLYFGPRELGVARFDPSRSSLYEPAFSSGSTVLYRVVTPALVTAARRQ